MLGLEALCRVEAVTGSRVVKVAAGVAACFAGIIRRESSWLGFMSLVRLRWRLVHPLIDRITTSALADTS